MGAFIHKLPVFHKSHIHLQGSKLPGGNKPFIIKIPCPKFPCGKKGKNQKQNPENSFIHALLLNTFLPGFTKIFLPESPESPTLNIAWRKIFSRRKKREKDRWQRKLKRKNFSPAKQTGETKNAKYLQKYFEKTFLGIYFCKLKI